MRPRHAPCAGRGACAASSRPPRTGSIAAQPRLRRRSAPRRRRPVRQGRAPLRPMPASGCSARRPSRPVRQGRAPLRRVERRWHDRRQRAGRPVRQGRAPLRPTHRGCGCAGAGARRPVRQGRAPLRPRAVARRWPRPAASSRPPRTGSIAAATGTAHDRRGCSRSSRPPRTGSIAASTGRRSDSGSRSGRPVRQGRAPLRHELGSRCPVSAGCVVPSAKDGLHCGSHAGHAGRPAPSWSSRPPRTGSIAAADRARSRRPADAASSRPPRTGSIAAGSCGPVVPPHRRVVPSAKDGLHCGASFASRLAS